MANPLLLSSLRLPSVKSRPSSTCLQWSADGQVFFVSNSIVHILTPHHAGIHPGCNIRCDKEAAGTLRWSRTIISLQKTDLRDWSAGSQEWAALSLGSFDFHVKDVACSPSYVTEDGGSVAAVLSSNMDLSLWSASKNSIQGEWIKVFDTTPFLVDLVSNGVPATGLPQLLQAQITSIAWSSQADFAITPAPCIDASLLAAGSRSGTVCLLRFDGKLASLRHIGTLRVSEKWVTHLAFSSWVYEGDSQCGGLLAYSTSDGSVGLIKIHLMAQLAAKDCGTFEPEYVVDTAFEAAQGIFSADQGGTTALEWITSQEKMILVRCRPGAIDLWCKLSMCSWSGTRTLMICPHVLSVGSSELHPVTGIVYIPQNDVLLVSLFDGTMRVIHKFFVDPEWAPESPSLVSSQCMSEAVRRIFVGTVEGIEQEEVTNSDVNLTSGLISFDGATTLLWTQQSFRPADLSWKIEARRDAVLIAARLTRHMDRTADAFFHELKEILTTSKSAYGVTPSHLLRPVFLWLSELPDLHANILNFLRSLPVSCPSQRHFPLWSEGLSEKLRGKFRNSLARSLFGCDKLLSLRLRLYVTEALSRCIGTPSGRTECIKVGELICKMISHMTMWGLLRHLHAVVPVLIANDMPFVRRVIYLSSLADSPPSVQCAARDLMNAIGAIQPPIIDRACLQGEVAMTEPCPACGEELDTTSTAHPACPNGHLWDCCTITSFIMATPMVRSCIGCKRKSFLPLSRQSRSAKLNWLPPMAQSWVVEELLEACKRCLYCGNNFVSIV
ncbi:transcription factor IIIC subunit delta N-term-domain-containing protein [Desarmillaria tabescens]|uniref:Transcription factor IIIC subunit delta N-term-domain-containing protein n=1 Tax=Armillaria tabescens TaxID=1929756 RepID=A0AA39KB64_ARMTA|nr:transcription factor IIIC subunit delta N-term-domain-containing protein [Desarmillaria tabescens]KAK0457870.1 transcription factor IIIC subunit delta N-term-domain-containing protein [Desarmillaria tabescens]